MDAEKVIKEICDMNEEELRTYIIKYFGPRYRNSPTSISKSEELFGILLDTAAYGNGRYNFSFYGNNSNYWVTVFEPWDFIHFTINVKMPYATGKPLLLTRAVCVWHKMHTDLVRRGLIENPLLSESLNKKEEIEETV